MVRVAVIGTGVYGQYIVECLLKKGVCIDWYDVKKNYKRRAIQKDGVFKYGGFEFGRRFGTGGTAKIWGGQMFTLDNVDRCYSTNDFYQDLIAGDEKAQHNGCHNSPVFSIKKGVWLFPWRKNNIRKLLSQRKVMLYSGYELSSHTETENAVHLSFRHNGKLVDRVYRNTVYVACGALANGEYFFSDFQWKDHISIPLFKIKGDKLLNKSISYSISYTGLKTWRLHFPELGLGHYVHFVYNEESVIKDLMRRVITSKSKVSFSAKALFKESFVMLWGLLNRRFANLDNEFIVMLDFEGGIGSFTSDENAFDFDIMDYHKEFVEGVKDRLKPLFIKEDLVATELPFNASKYEDIYHPFNINPPLNFQEYKKLYGKVLRIDTGLLASCGSTNPTGVLFPLIKTLIDNESYN